MASDHLIKETNKYLERIAKAAERTADALEKMVIEDDEDQEEPVVQVDYLAAFQAGLIGTEILSELKEITVETSPTEQGRRTCLRGKFSGDVGVITKAQATHILLTAKVNEISFEPAIGAPRLFREFEGWVGNETRT